MGSTGTLVVNLALGHTHRGGTKEKSCGVLLNADGFIQGALRLCLCFARDFRACSTMAASARSPLPYQDGECKEQGVTANIIKHQNTLRSLEARPFLSDAFQLKMQPKSCEGPVIPVLCHMLESAPLDKEVIFLKSLQRICVRSLPLLLLVIIVFANQGRWRIEVDI